MEVLWRKWSKKLAEFYGHNDLAPKRKATVRYTVPLKPHGIERGAEATRNAAHAVTEKIDGDEGV